MKYYLMHKDIQVASANINNENGLIMSIFDITAPDHLPVGVIYHNGKANQNSLDQWWDYRCIPEQRKGIDDALIKLKVRTERALAVRGNAVSLTDKYWIKPVDSNLKWADVDFFENPHFSDHVRMSLMGQKWDNCKKVIDYRSPDNTTNGNLPKFWKYEEGRIFLVKGGSNPYKQQPFNEVIASAIMRILDIPHVEYSLYNDEEPYSSCDCFVTPETEFVSAWQIYNTLDKPYGVSVYRHFLDSCEKLGIKDTVHAIDKMLVLDHIILNEDRHLNNFGFLRNPDTLEWIGAAPIFDSGTSLRYNRYHGNIYWNEDSYYCKPFKDAHKDQIKLVTSFDWIDFPKLDGLGDEIRAIFSAEQAKSYIDEKRCGAIIEMVEQNIESIRELAQSQLDGKSADRQGNDVMQDVAQSYEVEEISEQLMAENDKVYKKLAE